jgi:hypothetical protein
MSIDLELATLKDILDELQKRGNEYVMAVTTIKGDSFLCRWHGWSGRLTQMVEELREDFLTEKNKQMEDNDRTTTI